MFLYLHVTQKVLYSGMDVAARGKQRTNVASGIKETHILELLELGLEALLRWLRVGSRCAHTSRAHAGKGGGKIRLYFIR